MANRRRLGLFFVGLLGLVLILATFTYRDVILFSTRRTQELMGVEVWERTHRFRDMTQQCVRSADREVFPWTANPDEIRLSDFGIHTDPPRPTQALVVRQGGDPTVLLTRVVGDVDWIVESGDRIVDHLSAWLIWGVQPGEVDLDSMDW